MASPKEPLTLSAPHSTSTVRVRMIDTTSIMTIKSESFIKPVLKGQKLINITDVAFLIENETTSKRVLFDAGVRKDYWNLPATIQKRFGDVIPSLRVDKDVSEILVEADIPLESIESIIWSHYHWDHTGNCSLYPPTTSITVGPGFKAHPSLLPGFPILPNSPISASDFANRDLTEISFSSPEQLKIGGLPAHDYFNDGSFYLLDTPGHCVGHMCGLARTSINPDTFIFLGGDICHFLGAIRPNAAYPLPDPIPSGVLDEDPHFPVPCPCSLFTDLQPPFTQSEPFFQVSNHKKSAYIDPPTAAVSVGKLRDGFEEKGNVLVCIAHDPSLLAALPTLNKGDGDLNKWSEKGWKDDARVRWGWLNELPRGEGPGRGKLVDGFWRGGRKWNRDMEKEKGKL